MNGTHTVTKRTVGVEEELMLVGHDGTPIARAQDVLGSAEPADGPLEHEFMEEQIETAMPLRTTLEEIAAAIREGRAGAQAAAERHDARIAALGTSPLAFAGTTVGKLRYLTARAAFGLTAREQLTSGCHVHVGVASDVEGVAVLDRIGPWLAPLLALSANSPYWMGDDSGYASFRSQVWSRWPTAGPTRLFGTPEVPRRRAGPRRDGHDPGPGDGVLRRPPVGALPDLGDRVADARLSADTATLLAALARGLVETAARAADSPAPDVPVEILRTAIGGRDGPACPATSLTLGPGARPPRTTLSVHWWTTSATPFRTWATSIR